MNTSKDILHTPRLFVPFICVVIVLGTFTLALLYSQSIFKLEFSLSGKISTIDGTYEFDDVRTRSNASFAHYLGVLDLSHEEMWKHSQWIKIDTPTFDMPENIGPNPIIYIPFRPISNFKIYRPDIHGRYSITETGTAQGVYQADAIGLHYRFKVDREAIKKYPIYFYFNDSNNQVVKSLTFYLMSDEHYGGVNTKIFFIVAILYGALFSLLLFNLVLFLSTRKMAYLYYIVYLITAISTCSTADGIFYLLSSDTHAHAAYKFSEVVTVALFIAYLSFFLEVLRIKEKNKKLFKFARYFQLYFIMGIIYFSVRQTQTSLFIFDKNFMGVASLFINLIVIIYSIKKSDAYGKFILFAILPYAVASYCLIAYYAGSFYGLGYDAQIDSVGPWFINLGVVYEAIILSVLLGYIISDGERMLTTAERLASEQKRKADLASAKAAEKTLYMAFASHDLRQPINAIVLIGLNLEMSLVNENQRKQLRQLREATTSLRNSFEDIMDVSRIEYGVKTREDTHFDLMDCMEALLDEFSVMAKNKNITFNNRGLQGKRIFADQHAISRTLRNLLINAVKFTTKGGILVTCRSKGDFYRLDIIDTGPGISKEDQHKIFQMFVSLNKDNPQNGMGLGLYIVKTFLGMAGLQLDLTSVVGKGTRFSLWLPKSKESNMVFSKQPGRHALFTHKPVVLVIEDHDLTREVMQQLLTNWGCITYTAVDTFSARKTLRFETIVPDVIISDYNLTDKETGVEVAENLRKIYRKKIPTMIISGNFKEDMYIKGGSEEYRIIRKPLDPKQVYDFIARHSGG